MDGVLPDASAESLRLCVRDLVALSTLPAIWGDDGPDRIAASLLDVVVPMVYGDLGLVRLTAGETGSPIVAAHDGRRLLSAEEALRVAGWLLPLLDGSSGDTVEVEDPAGRRLRAVALPLGHGGDHGLLAVAAERAGFPADGDRLLLRVACNQATVAAQRRRAEEKLRRSERELSDFFENATVAIHWVGRDGRILRANRAELELLGYEPEEYVGHHIAEFHVDQEVIGDMLRRLVAGETLREQEARMRCKDGSIRRVLVDSNVRFEDGHFLNTRCFSRDVTDRRRAEETARFLADASRALAELMDTQSTLQRIAGLAVPRFADWCTVDMVDGDGTLQRLAVAHEDPARLEVERDMRTRFPGRPHDRLSARRVADSGEADWIPRVSEDVLQEVAQDGEHLRLLRELGVRSYLAVPLRARERVLGVLTFANFRSGRFFDERDVRIAEDLSSRAVVAIENSELLAALREADRRKDEFLAILAHELRNPLAPLRNALEILHARGPATPQLAAARAMIDRQIRHMTRLVDDLLDVSRISRGKIDLRWEVLDLRTVVGNAIEASRPGFEAAAHRLTIHIPEEPVHVRGDALRLAQVVSNLLDNACKYTPRGGSVEVTLEARETDAVVRVRDDGTGIPREMLPRVFEIFTQVDHSLERRQGGLGIGLTLVQRLVQIHGGEVRAHSDGPGRGSEFTICLPRANDLPAGRTAEGARPEAFSGRRILVVDDNRDAADSLALLLELRGHEVEVAYDGRAALESAAGFLPDLVLLDIGLPEINGYEAARRLRANPAHRDAILIALTGWGQEEDRQRSREAGFDHHLTKPVDLDALDRLLVASPSRSRG